MALYFATLTLLIIAVLGIRAVFKRTVSPRLIYALWIAAVIRLCLPISLFEADFLTVFAEHDESVPAEVILPADEADGNEKTEENEAIILETAVPETEYVMPEGYAPAVTMPAPAVPGPVPQLPEMPEYSVPETEIPAEIIEEPEVSETPDEADSRDYANEIRRILILVWIGGAALMALWFTASGCVFRYRLCRDRKYSGSIGRTKIYVSSSVGAPCLSGLIPEIYITPEVDNNPSRELVVLHEYTHLCHLDHVWSLIRMAALCVHWFNPFVWAAAFISKQDAELACDDAICSKLGEEKRFQYARVLIETIPQKHRYATGLGSAPMKQRILRLTKRQKNHLICAFFAVVLIITAVGCSFVGLRKPTFESIVEQKGFTILSQDLRTVDIRLNMDELPSYEELSADYADNELYAGSEWRTDGIIAAEEGMSRIVLKSVKSHVTHQTAADDEITLTFAIEQDFRDDAGTVLAVYYMQNTDNELHQVHCWYAAEILHHENGGYFDAVAMGHSESDNSFSVCIPTAKYAQLSGSITFSVVLNEIAYERGDEVRTYGVMTLNGEEFFGKYYEDRLKDQVENDVKAKEAQLREEYQRQKENLSLCLERYQALAAELKSNMELRENLRMEEESIIDRMSAGASEEAKAQLETELTAKRAKADEIKRMIEKNEAQRELMLAEVGEIRVKMAEAAAWLDKYAQEPFINGAEKLPLGQLETAQISYTPIVYEITQDMALAMISDDMISTDLGSITVDGLEVFLFKGSNGSVCAGYRKDGISYQFLIMAYPGAAVREYSLKKFEDILGHDGFVIEWGGAHVYRYYYTLSKNEGIPDIFLPVYGNVIECDFDCDGITEVIASETSYSKVYDLYYEEEGDAYGFVSSADLTAEQDKTGFLAKYDPENEYFVFSYKKDMDDTVYNRYGIANGSKLTLSTPFEDIDPEDNSTNGDSAPSLPVNVTYMNTDRAVHTVLVPISGANPGFNMYSYNDRYSIMVTCDSVADRNGEWCNADAKIVVIDNEKGRIAVEYEIGDLYGYPSRAFGMDCAYLYRAGLNTSGEFRMNYAYKIDFSGETVTVSDGADEFDWYTMIEKIEYSPDGRTAAAVVHDNEWNDGGLDIHYPDGRIERVFDSNLTAHDINDIISYIPVGFADDTHFVYTIGGWEWSRGYGIYNTETGEDVRGTKNYRILGVHDGAIYAAYENDGKRDYGISKMEIWKITLDGNETMIAATHDVPEGVYRLSMEEYMTFVNGVWVFYETGHIDGWSSSDLPQDGIIGARVMSADFSAVLLEFDFYFNWQTEGSPAVTENAFTICCPVMDPSAPDTASTVAGVIYRCDDVYILENTTVHGDYRVTFPNGTGDYRIYACSVLLCDDGCDLTDVVSRAVWGYAPAYRIDQYDAFTASDGWSYSGRQYYNIVPEEIAGEMVRQMTEGGAEQHQIDERLGNRRYIWLLELGDNMYLFTVLEAANYRTEKPENENEIVNSIMQSAVVEVKPRELSAVEIFRDSNPDYFENAYPQFQVQFSHEFADGSALMYLYRGGLPHGMSQTKFFSIAPDGSFTDLLEDEDNKALMEDTSLYYTTPAYASGFSLNEDGTKLVFRAAWSPSGGDKESWEKTVELDIKTGKMKSIPGGNVLWSYPLSDQYELYYTEREDGQFHLYYKAGETVYLLTDLHASMMLHGQEDAMHTVLPIYVNQTENGFTVCLSYTMLPYYILIKMNEENGRLTYRGVEDIDSQAAEANPAYKEVTVTVHSLEELAEYNARHIISDKLYKYLSEFIGDTSPIAAFNTVRISDFEITFTVPVKNNRVLFDFTVASSGLDTLPPGKYHREVFAYIDIVMHDPDAVRENPFGEIEEVKKLLAFISGSYLWNTPVYGKGIDYPGIHNYICGYYSEGGSGTLRYEDYRKIAAAEFGVEDFSALGILPFVTEDGMIYQGGMGGSWNGDVVDVRAEEELTTVVMQFYADSSCLLKSHRIGYKFSHDGKWMGYDILESSEYAPNGLRYSPDAAEGKNDTLLESFMPYYSAAERIMKWFSGRGFSGSQEQLQKFFGYDYLDISNDYAIVSNGITDLDSMRSHLSSVFTERMTGELMKKCADESYAPAEGERSLPVFLFIDGKTWIIASAGEPRAYDTPVFSMNTVTENEAVMALTIHRMRYDYLLGRYITSEVGDLYSIRFEKSGDIWLCDEFPVFW